jgi:hypothetical protein
MATWVPLAMCTAALHVSAVWLPAMTSSQLSQPPHKGVVADRSGSADVCTTALQHYSTHATTPYAPSPITSCTL